MKTISILSILIFVITLSSCKKNDKTQKSQLQFTEIAKGALHGVGQESISQSNLVIDNNSDWQNLMNKMNTVNNETQHFTETNIDFSQYTIIAIFLEVKSNGWEVEITDIENNGCSITVTKTEKICECTVMTQPFHIVKIQRTNLPIEFLN